LAGRTDFIIFTHGPDKKTTAQYVDQLKPSIVIVNAGAHLKDLGDLMSIWENIKVMSKRAFEKYGTKFVWKTQNPGTVGCWHYKAPVNRTFVFPLGTLTYHSKLCICFRFSQ
jgi:hypothetical protein